MLKPLGPAIIFCLLPALLKSQAQKIVTEVDGLLKEAKAKDVFSGTVLIADHGNIIYNKALGEAEHTLHIPNTVNTAFEIASITKIFTKALILQLIGEGKANAGDPIDKYLAGFAPAAGKITLQQLMDHSSGLGNYSEEQGWNRNFSKVKSVQDILEYVKKEEPGFEPGSRNRYSNSGYVVLAGVVEKITGKSYRLALKQLIFDKLGMTHSTFSVQQRNGPGKATGYLSNQPGPLKDNSKSQLVAAGDGGIYSTTGDLWKFVHSLMNDNVLLSNENKAKLFSVPLMGARYANWEEFLQKGRVFVAGGAEGRSSIVGINMQKDYAIIVLSNYDEGTAEAIAQRIVSIMNNMQPAPLHLPPSKFMYHLVQSKGPDYFKQNYEKEFEAEGIDFRDNDMNFLFAGDRLLAEHKLKDAQAIFEVYTKEFPRIVIALDRLGDIYLKTGNPAAAKAVYEKALALRPGDEHAKQNLSKIKNN